MFSCANELSFTLFLPAIREKLTQFGELHLIDSGKHVCQIFNRVETVPFSRCHQREVNCQCLSTSIRAWLQPSSAILSDSFEAHQYRLLCLKLFGSILQQATEPLKTLIPSAVSPLSAPSDRLPYVSIAKMGKRRFKARFRDFAFEDEHFWGRRN